MRLFLLAAVTALPLTGVLAQAGTAVDKKEPRARDLGIPFDGTPGPSNAITDVTGVEVGYKTLISGEGRLAVGKGPVRTGVTAILPRGKAGQGSVFAGYFAGNGNGDMTGTHWIDESGLLETPILITNTGSVGVVRDAAVAWLVKTKHPGDFWYPVTAETADVPLNDIKGQHVTAQDALEALTTAARGAIAEGNVGGGTGMVCNGFKGGMGTSSRVLPAERGGYSVGVLVQCNYGGSNGLRVAGIPVAREMKLQRPCVAKKLDPPVVYYGTTTPAAVCDPAIATTADGVRTPEEGSIIVVVATDAPLTPDQLKRLARRVSVGLGRVGAIEGDESGDIFLAFSTANTGADEGNSEQHDKLPNARIERMQSWKLDAMFTAVVQATEEAVINTIVAAKTMTGADYWVIPAIPHDQLQDVLKKHGMLKQ